jgi:hypothetical protein
MPGLLTAKDIVEDKLKSSPNSRVIYDKNRDLYIILNMDYAMKTE